MNKVIPPLSKSSHPLETTDAEVCTILVVDDDRRFAQALAVSLGDFNFHTLLAHDGNVGLATAICREPDFLLLDTRMPARSGYLVMEYLVTQTDLCIPTILLGDNEGERHKSYGKMLGALDFLDKPIKSAEVAAKIAALLKPRCRQAARNSA